MKTNSVRNVAHQVTQFISKLDFNSALSIIYNTVLNIISEPLCTSQILSSKQLDRLCQEIGKHNLEAIKNQEIAAPKQHIFVYIVTKIQNSGGHSRVIFDLIQSRRGAKHYILSTELDGRSDAGFLDIFLSGQSDVYFEMPNTKSFIGRLDWLQRRLLTLSPEKVFLFNHHQDSVAVSAVQPSMGFDLIYYHHGDHHLCLGVHLPHAKHIDCNPATHLYCQDQLEGRAIYAPLSVADQGYQENRNFLRDGKLTTCTVGRSNKIDIPYFITYAEVIAQRLSVIHGVHIHIGKLTRNGLAKIKKQLRNHGVDSDRFLYIPWVKSVWNTLLEHKVDLYICSFPIGGALAMIEAMGAGIPIAVHSHIYSRILSGNDFAPPDAFRWRQPEELLIYCQGIDSESLSQRSTSVRRHYEAHYAGNAVEDILTIHSATNTDALKSSVPYTIQHDEWGLWMAEQMTIRNVLFRRVYRLLKKVRMLLT